MKCSRGRGGGGGGREGEGLFKVVHVGQVKRCIEVILLPALQVFCCGVCVCVYVYLRECVRDL